MVGTLRVRPGRSTGPCRQATRATEGSHNGRNILRVEGAARYGDVTRRDSRQLPRGKLRGKSHIIRGKGANRNRNVDPRYSTAGGYHLTDRGRCGRSRQLGGFVGAG